MVAITAGRSSFADFENDVKISFLESAIYYAALKDVQNLTQPLLIPTMMKMRLTI